VTAKEYLYATKESNRLRELALGMVREPPAPFFSHQSVVLKVARVLADHVGPRNLGRVAIAPIDVILDHDRALVLQPDVLFVTTERLGIIREQVWGPPDLVVEVMSANTESLDRGEKLAWYRQYRVRECWLVDVYREEITVVDFTGAFPVEQVAKGVQPIRSTVLPDLQSSGFGIFS
jgi:Uma2 family endonuclease